MNPLTLHARNYRCFSELDLDLPDGCVAIIGDNGHGKSAIVEAVEVALYGECRTGRLPAQLTTSCVDELLLELDLEHAGELYRIRRTFSPRGRGKATLDFEQCDDDVAINGAPWVSLTCASTRETQELIDSTFGLSRETFRASAFLAQGDGAAFTDAQPRDRKRILAQVLGLDRYDHLQERARQDRRTIEAEQLTLDGRTQAARTLVEQKPTLISEHQRLVEALTGLADTIAGLEREHAALSERYQQAREQVVRRQAAEAELREASTALSALEQRQTAADAAARAIVDAVEQLRTLPPAGDTVALEQREAELVGQIEEHARQSHERELLLRAHDELSKRRDDVWLAVKETDELAAAVRTKIVHTTAQPDATCETCGQHLDAAAKKQTIAAYTAEVDQHLAKGASLAAEARAIVLPVVPPGLPPAPTVQLAEVREQLRAVREAAATRAQLEERIRQNEPAAAGGPTPDELTGAHALVAAKAAAVNLIQVVDLEEITTAGGLVRQRLDTGRASLEQQQTLKARLDERLSQVTTAGNEIELAAAARIQLQQQLDVTVLLERAFGRDGIPALIVENAAIPYLETEANRIVGELGTSYRVELRTQAELKSGDGLRDTLDVVVQTENGERAYETFSGGERTRINLALRIALARLLAHRRGAESRLLAIDEPDGLDEHGMAALVEVLRGLQADFDKLYVVSHVPGLRDSFDTTLSVVRDADGLSRISDAGWVEAVVA